MPNALTYIFAGGGTGGHLYPGLAIAEALRARAAGRGAAAARCVFVCSTRPIDAAILGAEGAEFTALSAAPFGVHPKRLLKFVRAWRGSVRAATAILQGVQGEGSPGRASVVVVAMGGFVAAPVVAAAAGMGLPVALVNLDAVPGKANRWIAKRARVALSATGASDRAPSGWRRIPPIVRSAALGVRTAAEARARLGLRPEVRTLFVSGGSQGARSINGALARIAASNSAMFAGWQVFHQAGEGEDARLREAYAKAGVSAAVVAFCREMGDAWAAADLAVTRCGAGAVGEVWASATPAIFLPYPYHRDEHQKWNAKPLEAVGGAVILRDEIEPEANAQTLGPALESLLRDEARREGMRRALRTLGPADGAERAAAALEALGGGPG